MFIFTVNQPQTLQFEDLLEANATLPLSQVLRNVFDLQIDPLNRRSIIIL